MEVKPIGKDEKRVFNLESIYFASLRFSQPTKDDIFSLRKLTIR